MRILITGSREHEDVELIEYAIESQLNYAEEITIVHGDCPRGADAIADQYAMDNDLQVERHPADWERYSKKAGIIRNQEMVDLGADICIAFPIGKSPGTRHCANAAKRAGIKTIIIES